MSPYRVKVTKQAIEHLQGIRDHILFEFFAPNAARDTLARLGKSITSLASNPYRIKTIEEEPWRGRGVRKLIVKNYYVYFWVDEDIETVYVIAVIYSGRDQEEQLSLALV